VIYDFSSAFKGIRDARTLPSYDTRATSARETRSV